MRECSGSLTPCERHRVPRSAGWAGDQPRGPSTFAAAVPHRVWERFEPGEGPERLAAVIGELRAGDNRFSMEGGSWTTTSDGMRGYGDVLALMERARSSASTCRPRACRQATLATGARCSTCWPVKPAAPLLGPGHLDGLRRRARPPRLPGCQLGDLTAERPEPKARVAPASPTSRFLRRGAGLPRPAVIFGRGAPGIAVRPAPVPGVADLGADAAQVVGELGGVLVTGQGHGAWRRSYRDPGRAAPVPDDLAS